MRITGFDWNDGNVEHVGRHQVLPEEAEEVFLGKWAVRRARGGYYTALGKTLAGRYLFVVYSVLGEGTIRVITARDMSTQERKRYRRG